MAEAIPPVAVRLRRDFKTILSLIRTHAILHQITAVSTDMNSSHAAPEVPSTETTKETLGVNMNESTAGLPDWLVSSVQSSAIPESNSSGSEEKIEKKPRKKAGPKSETSIQ